MLYHIGMNKEQIIESAKVFIKEIFKNNAGGHDYEHTIRVYNNAINIAKDYPGCDLLIVSLSSLLHDVDDHKLCNHENNENARMFLNEQNVPNEIVECVCQVINEVSFSKNKDKKPSTLEAMVVQDADRLDAIGAIGVARAFAYGGQECRPLESSIRHFYEKLLLLKDKMNTETAKKMAEERHQFLVNFLTEYNKETK